MGHFYLNKAEGGEEMERLYAFQSLLFLPSEFSERLGCKENRLVYPPKSAWGCALVPMGSSSLCSALLRIGRAPALDD